MYKYSRILNTHAAVEIYYKMNFIQWRDNWEALAEGLMVSSQYI